MKQSLITAGFLVLLLVGISLIQVKLSKANNNTETTTETTLNLGNNSTATLTTPLTSPQGKMMVATTTKKTPVSNLNLTSDNTVLLLGEIGSNAVFVAQELQRKAKYNKELYLLIDSPGGSVFDGMDIIDVIENSKVPINTICVQGCFSMGAIIFEYGKSRFIVPRSILMFHSASGAVQGPFYQMKTRLAFFDRVINKLSTEIAHRVGIDAEQFKAQMPSELWLDGQDAIELNFADKLATVSLDVTSKDQAATDLISKIQPLKDKIQVNVR